MSLRESGDIFSVVNELDKISTIILPPEDMPENIAQLQAKQNPYFQPSIEHEHPEINKYGSMLNNYKAVVSVDSYRMASEREMLSSQYSSVASTIIDDKHKIKRSKNEPISVNSANRNFIVRNASNKKRGGKGGKPVFPTDFFGN